MKGDLSSMNIVNILNAFWVGGLICVIGQLLIDKTSLTPARILVGFLIAGVILSAFGLYPYLVDFAGAGATVPLSGFGNVIAQGVKKAVEEQGFFGIFTGALTAGSAGITAAVFFSLLAAVFFRSRPK